MPESPQQELGGAWYNSLQVLEDTALATAVREGRWLYPGVEILHIIGFVVLVGAAFMFDLRLLGASKQIPIKDLGRHLLRWSQGSVLIVVPSGVVLFMSDAEATWQNSAFRVKLILIALAALNALIFHRWTSRRVQDWNVGLPAPPAAKFTAIASLLLWTGVITSGRLIAYI